MEVLGLRSERVTLVPSEASLHLENALRWFNDPLVTRYLLTNSGVTRRQEEEFFEALVCRRENNLHWAILVEGLGHIGFAALNDIDWRVRKVVGGLILGEPAAWGHGFATEVLKVRNQFAFEQLGLHRVEGHSINPAMCRVYEKAGYQKEGVSRQLLWRDGRWHDAHLYAILESDYFDAHAKISLTTTP